MKAKLSLDKNAVQTFFLENVEKIVLGAVGLLFLLMLYSAIFGRDRYPKGVRTLIDDAGKAESHWAGTKIEENDDYKKCTAPNYLAIASKGQEPVRVGPYAHATGWSKSLFPALGLRPFVAPLPIEELHAVAGRGPFLKSGGGPGIPGMMGGPVAAGAGARGLRWVALVGVVPVRKQFDAFKKAFDKCQVPKPESDVPFYEMWNIERAEVTGHGTENLTWEPINFVEARKNAVAATGKGQPDPLDPKFQDARYISRNAIFELPTPGSGTWDPNAIRHARIVGPPFTVVRLDPRAYEGQKVTWQGEPIGTDGTRVIYGPKPTGTQTAKQIPDSEYFAVDYPSPEAARGASRGLVTGIVKGKVDVTIPKGTGADGKPITRPAAVTWLQDATVTIDADAAPAIDPRTGKPVGGEGKTPTRRLEGGQDAELADCQLFRFIDFSVQPGKQYRYRVSAWMKNPNFGIDPHALEKPDLAKDENISSKPCEPSPVVAVPPDTRIFAGPVTPPPRIIGEPQGSIKIKRWVETNGIEAGDKFACFRGTLADFTGTFPKKGNREKITPFQVNYTTGSVVLDMRGERLGRGNTLIGPGEFILLDAEGGLRVYNELDTEDYAASDEEDLPATEPGAVPGLGPVTPGRGLEGLNF